MRSQSLREKADCDQRIDSLLDRLAEVQAQLAVCTELDGISEQASNAALEICVAANVEMAARLLIMKRFIDACKQTAYRPEAWELELVLSTPITGESLR